MRLLLANKSITIKFKDQENCPDLTPKVLVDATGPTDKLESLVKKHPVLANPMIISAHPLGGIDVNFQTMQVRNSQQEPQTRVFAIGKITCGRFLSTSNLHQTLRQAERAALTVWENVQLSQQGEEKRLATGSNKRPSAVAEATDEQKTKKARLITSEPSSNLTKPEPGGACSRPLLRRYASSPANAAGQSLGMFPKLPSLEQKQETSRAIPQAASQTASQATSQESYFSAPRKERRKSPAEPASQGSYFSYS
ncbi:MAG: hypothetical protein K0U12_04545 [Gammaproteobacteria bacterium]|nr:hypothetical protein [Gammaproteobacteria bacterium]